MNQNDIPVYRNSNTRTQVMPVFINPTYNISISNIHVQTFMEMLTTFVKLVLMAKSFASIPSGAIRNGIVK